MFYRLDLGNRFNNLNLDIMSEPMFMHNDIVIFRKISLFLKN